MDEKMNERQRKIIKEVMKRVHQGADFGVVLSNWFEEKKISGDDFLTITKEFSNTQWRKYSKYTKANIVGTILHNMIAREEKVSDPRKWLKFIADIAEDGIDLIRSYHDFRGLIFKEYPAFFSSDFIIKKLSKMDKTGETIVQAAKVFPTFAYKKALDFLKQKGGQQYALALASFPKGVKETKKIMDRLEKQAQKLKTKKLKLKEDAFNELLEITANVKINAESVYKAGLREKNFNYEKGLDTLIDLDKNGYWIRLAGANWSKFDYEKGLDALIKTDKTGEWIYHASTEWPKINFKKALDSLIKLDKTGEWIYYAGMHWPKFEYKFDYEKALDALIEKDKDGGYILNAGQLWSKFNYEKGLDALIKKDKDGNYIYRAGSEWPKFNYEKGLDILIKKDKTGKWIYSAGLHWPKFDHEKGLNVLKGTKYYDKAIEHWPKGIKQTKEIINQLKKKSQKMPTKKLKLKEDAFNELLEITANAKINAESVYKAGRQMKNFDYEGGLDTLIDLDKTGFWIRLAGTDWPTFDYKKGLDALIKKGEAEWIYHVATEWPKINFKKTLDALIKTDKTGEWIYYAGIHWPKFEYKKGLDALKNKKEYYYRKALKHWPKGVKETKEAINQLKQKSQKLPTKKLKLKEITATTNVAEKIDFLYNEVKNKKNKISAAKNIISDWLTELYSKNATAATVHRRNNDLTKLFTPFQLYCTAIKERDKKLEQEAKQMYARGIKEIKQRFHLNESATKKIMDVYYKGFYAKEDTNKLLKDLADSDKSGEWITSAGLNWKNFNYKKGLEYLDGKSRAAEYIFQAGKNWKEFDYERGIELLIKNDKTGKWIYLAGRLWPKFNYGKSLNALSIKNKAFFRDALNQWELGAKETKKIINQLKKKSQKMPTKKLKLKEDASEDLNSIYLDKLFNDQKSKFFDYEKGFEKLVKLDKRGDWIFLAGKQWKQFDYEKGLEELAKKQKAALYIYKAGENWPKFNYKRGLDLLAELSKKTVEANKWIFRAGTGWPEFDYNRGIKILYNNYKKVGKEKGNVAKLYYRLALKYWPKNTKQTIEIIDQLKQKSKKFPGKKLKLKEYLNEEKDLSSMSAKEIFDAGDRKKDFDYEKGLDALIKNDKDGKWIYLAGKNWKKFDYEKGLDALIKKDKTGRLIYWSAMEWPKFNYEKGLNILKGNSYYYKRAIKHWPKGVKETKEIIDQLKQKAPKLPTKKLKLKESLNEEKDLSSMSAEEIFNAGKNWKQFDYEKGLEELAKKDRTGRFIYYAGLHWPKFDYRKGLEHLTEKWKKNFWIYNAGLHWPKFDYERGLDALIKKDKTGRWIYYAGEEWPKFNYEKGFNALIKKDKSGSWICGAGKHWPEFDHEKGLETLIKNDKTGRWIFQAGKEWPKFDYIKAPPALLKIDKDGEWIYLAGVKWPRFNYKKALQILKGNNEYYYKKALKNWSKGVKETKRMIDQLEKKASKLPTKKLKLK